MFQLRDLVPSAGSDTTSASGSGGFTHLVDLMFGKGDLSIVDDVIGDVLAVVEEQLGKVNAATFESGAHIPGHWLGAGQTAQALAHHHERAHAVVVDTLTGVHRDLTRFGDAIRQAKQLMAEADTGARDQITQVLARTEGIQFGESDRRAAEIEHSDLPAPAAPAAPAPSTEVNP